MLIRFLHLFLSHCCCLLACRSFCLLSFSVSSREMAGSCCWQISELKNWGAQSPLPRKNASQILFWKERDTAGRGRKGLWFLCCSSQGGAHARRALAPASWRQLASKVVADCYKVSVGSKSSDPFLKAFGLTFPSRRCSLWPACLPLVLAREEPCVEQRGSLLLCSALGSLQISRLTPCHYSGNKSGDQRAGFLCPLPYRFC